ncbi:MAG TPA: DUF1573 domain-containing protein [Candidatus Portnoybacteria bacterium]|nr:DUF1573 domain-containing protein [Candidatus Portnoybacteria bacterium]
MKPKITAFIVLGLIILGLAVYGYFKAVPRTENQTGDQPQIEISPEYFDFGEIEFGQIVEYNFRVKNTGKEVLKIKKIATSCGCTTAKIDKKKISPGEEVDLRVVYNTAAMGGAHGRGKQERIIYLKSNDSTNPQVEVMIYAVVK